MDNFKVIDEGVKAPSIKDNSISYLLGRRSKSSEQLQDFQFELDTCNVGDIGGILGSIEDLKKEIEILEYLIKKA